MDIRCPRCGEPYDTDHVSHDMTAAERADLLAGRGCSLQCRAAPPAGTASAIAAAAVLELSGDDLDGAAADLDALGLAG